MEIAYLSEINSKSEFVFKILKVVATSECRKFRQQWACNSEIKEWRIKNEVKQVVTLTEVDYSMTGCK